MATQKSRFSVGQPKRDIDSEPLGPSNGANQAEDVAREGGRDLRSLHHGSISSSEARSDVTRDRLAERLQRDPIPTAIIGAPGPYCEAVFDSLDLGGFSPRTPDDPLAWAQGPDSKIVVILVSDSSEWSIVERVVSSSRTTTVALTPDPHLDHYVRALKLGCDGVVPLDNPAKVIA